MKGEKNEDLTEIPLDSGKTIGNLTVSENVSAETHDLGFKVIEDENAWASEQRSGLSAGFQGSIFAPQPRSEIVEVG